MTTDRRGLLAHPERHPGDDAGRDDHRRALIEGLRVAVELAGGDEQDRADRGARDDPGAHPEPNRPGVLGEPPRLREVGEDERDDQRRLEAFAQGDHECAHAWASISILRVP